jgi:hypothetical protein
MGSMTRTANEILSQEFLQVRAKILEIAAFYDRMEEAKDRSPAESLPIRELPATELSGAEWSGNELNSRQWNLLQHGCQILTDSHSNKAARIQLLFSRPYAESWREQFGI